VATLNPPNAVQAANFINNILSNPVTPQTVINVLKENSYHSVINKKCALLSVAAAAGLSWVVYLEK